MGKKQKAAPQVEAMPAHKPAPLIATAAFGMLAFLVAGSTTYLLASEPKPLGIPIPRPPRPIYTVTKGADANSSVIHRRLPIGWLGRLAPQPDGLPYLHEHHHSEKLGYDISYPYGTENIDFGMDSFQQDWVDSQATVKIDQPLVAVKVSFPANNSKKQLNYVKDLTDAALKQGAKPVDPPHEVKMPGAGFATVAYRRNDPDNNYVHRLYCAGVGARVLIFDFFINPQTATDGDRYASKIMRSFEPGQIIGPSLEEPVQAATPAKAASTPPTKSH